MLTNTKTFGRGTIARALSGAALAVLVIACSPDEILDVEDIDVALPESVADSTAVPALLSGAIGNFGNAYNGGIDINMVALAGMISDEYINTETFPTRIEVDQRTQQITNGSLSGSFYAIQQARSFADMSARAHGRFASLANGPGMAESLNLAALAIVLMAENYCGAVPLSRQLPDGSFEHGPQLSTRDLLLVAIRKADSVLTTLTSPGTTQLRVARIAKARAQLNLDDPAGAAATIGGTAGVPTNFQYNYIHSELTGRQNNGTWGLVQNSGRFGVADREGVVGLPFRSEGDTVTTNPIRDPRVANIRRPTNNGRGFDGATNMWWQLKYPVRAAPIIIADGIEARLIEAEADIRAGNYANALVTMNNLRASASTLRGYNRNPPALTAAVGLAAQIDQLFKERAYWLFLTSHRLGDMRRLTRPTTAAAAGDITGYGRAVNTVFPNGAYHKSGTYGSDVNSPIPQAEDNNPNFDRAQCLKDKP